MAEEFPSIVSARLEEAMKSISRRSRVRPEVGVILGSGQGGFSRRLESAEYIPFRQIPYFFQPTVPGHEGIMSLGCLGGRCVAVLEGRTHLYEGYFMREITFPVRVLHRLGVRDLIVCNAAGGLSPRLACGQIMVISDHLNLMGGNPLIGQIHQSPESPFLDMSLTYDPGLRGLAESTGREMGEEVVPGVLAAVPGPCYETPAESRMLAALGADAVTMSTVPEVIMARFLGMRVLGLSLITNLHTPGSALAHSDVLQVARRRTAALMELIARVVSRMEPAAGPAGGTGEGEEVER